MAAKHTAIGSTPTVAWTRASTSRKAMTQATEQRAYRQALETGLDDLVGQPVERAGPAGARHRTLRRDPAAPPDEEQPQTEQQPEQQTGHATAWASSADRS